MYVWNSRIETTSTGEHPSTEDESTATHWHHYSINVRRMRVWRSSNEELISLPDIRPQIRALIKVIRFQKRQYEYLIERWRRLSEEVRELEEKNENLDRQLFMTTFEEEESRRDEEVTDENTDFENGDFEDDDCNDDELEDFEEMEVEDNESDEHSYDYSQNDSSICY
ncbi:hypothetical protein M3Y98_00724000 [Aphelenchoides besseyi]|nr:hypothetical protein M3Y98_00724000 [Aphelenchoides besseyi]KAI6210209.1 hypothetical protein M3Y96_00303400 [Aphelenchoides besseyi]